MLFQVNAPAGRARRNFRSSLAPTAMAVTVLMSGGGGNALATALDDGPNVSLAPEAATTPAPAIASLAALPPAAPEPRVDAVSAGEATTAAAPNATSTGFDIEMLRSRGIDPKVAEYFMEQARFTPGMALVTLSVNGKRKGTAMARFDERGQLCFDSRLLSRAGLQIPGDLPGEHRQGDATAAVAEAASGGRCIDFRAAYPQTIVTLKPATAAVELFVPTDALRTDAPGHVDYTTGGVAALLNYDLLAVGNSTGDSRTRYLSAYNEIGFNAGDWIVRNRNVYSNDGNTSNFSHLYAFAQRTFVDQQAVFQGGEINVSNSIFPGPSIYGAQWVPEMALKRTTNSGAVVEGIAQTQARVEVRQAGALIYTTVVPPGPFTLTNIPLLNGSNDLDVAVVEATGGTRRFTIPAAQLSAGSLGITPGYALAAGKLRQLGDDALVKPWMATGTGTWQLGKNAGVTGGLLMGSQYQGVGGGLDAKVFTNTSASVRALMSNATREALRGSQLTGSVSTLVTSSLSFNATATQQSRGYRSLNDTTQDTTADWINSHYRGQYTVGGSWSHPVLGGFSVNYSRSSLFSGDTTQRVTGSWGRTFRYATVSLSLEKSIGTTNGNNGTDGNSIYLSVSIPMGRRSVRAYVNRVDGSTRLGSTYSEMVNDVLNYSVNAESRPGEGTLSASANAAVTPYYTRLNMGVAQYSGDSTSYNAELSGGVVAHKNGVTFSPYAVGDTFGIASLGDVPGIKISTPQGPVWTDPWGQAVISSAAPYSQSRLEVSTKSLPRNVDITNAYMQINPGRGSVSHVDFDVVKVRRILLQTVDATGTPLPRNATVTDSHGNFVTTVLNDGTIFLSNSSASSGLRVMGPDGRSCVLQYTLPLAQDLNAYFDEVKAVCTPAPPPLPEGEKK